LGNLAHLYFEDPHHFSLTALLHISEQILAHRFALSQPRIRTSLIAGMLSLLCSLKEHVSDPPVHVSLLHRSRLVCFPSAEMAQVIAYVIHEVINRDGWSVENSLVVIYSMRQGKDGYPCEKIGVSTIRHIRSVQKCLNRVKLNIVSDSKS